MGLVDHRQNHISRVVYGKGAEEGRQKAVAVVTLGAIFLGRTGLPSHQIAFHISLAAGAMLDRQTQQLAHAPRGLGVDHAHPGRRRVAQQQCRRAHGATIDEPGGGAGQLQWANRNAVTEADGRGIDVAPARGCHRCADFRQRYRRRAQQAEAGEKSPLPVAA